MQPEPTSLPPPSSPPSPIQPFTLTKRRAKLTLKGARLTASTLLLFAAILLAASMALSWWGASASGGGHATVLGFLPGADYRAQTGSNLSYPSYVSAGLVHVGQLYEAVLAVGVVATVAGFVAMLLSYLGALNAFKTRRFQPITFLFGFIAFVGAAALPAAVAGGQPGAFNADSTSGFGGAGCGASPNPCTSFWNSISTGGVTVSWGADVGWYLSVIAAVLLLVGLLILWNKRKMPYTRDEETANWSGGA